MRNNEIHTESRQRSACSANRKYMLGMANLYLSSGESKNELMVISNHPGSCTSSGESDIVMSCRRLSLGMRDCSVASDRGKMLKKINGK
jgi:hypothetical protein